MKTKISVIVLSLFYTLSLNAQCAMCRAVLESGDDQAAAEGINDGIMFLMAVPYLLVAVIGYIVYRSFKNTRSSTT